MHVCCCSSIWRVWILIDVVLLKCNILSCHISEALYLTILRFLISIFTKSRVFEVRYDQTILFHQIFLKRCHSINFTMLIFQKKKTFILLSYAAALLQMFLFKLIFYFFVFILFWCVSIKNKFIYIYIYIYYFDAFSIKKILIKNHYHNIKHTQNRLIVS
jgi:hypothetical protein